MRETGQPGDVSRGEIGEGALERHHEVLDRPLDSLDEGCGDRLRPRVDADGRSAEGVRLPHLPVDVEKRDPLAVQRDLDLLALGGLVVPENLSETPVIEGHDDHVLPVRGEVVPHHETPAGPEGRSFHVAELRDRLGNDVGLDRG